MVSTRPLISKCSSPCINRLVAVTRAPIIIGIIVTFMFHSFFKSLAKGPVLPSFRFLSILLCGKPGQQSSQFGMFSFFVDYYEVWSSGRDKVIFLYLKIPEEFVCLIFQDGFWIVHIQFIRVIKFKFLAQFPVDYLAHPVVSNLILFLC